MIDKPIPPRPKSFPWKADDLPRRAKASDYLYHLADLLEGRTTPLRVWLYCRKSNCGTDNLADQKAQAIDLLIAYGSKVHVVGCTTCVENSNIHAHRQGLDHAISQAEANDAILVALHRDRLVRCILFDGTNERETPRHGDYRLLLWFARGTAVATIHDPDASPSENRSIQTMRGMKTKGNPGGRPRIENMSRSDRRAFVQPKVRKLVKKFSIREIQAIARKHGFPLSTRTIWEWSR